MFGTFRLESIEQEIRKQTIDPRDDEESVTSMCGYRIQIDSVGNCLQNTKQVESTHVDKPHPLRQEYKTKALLENTRPQHTQQSSM